MEEKIERLNSRERKVKERDKVKAINELRQEYNLMVLLDIAGVTRSTFYYHLNKMKEPDKYKEIKEEIELIFFENKGRYSYRRITLELENRGFNINHKQY